MKRLAGILVLFLSLSASAQWLGQTPTWQRNTTNGAWRLNGGANGVLNLADSIASYTNGFTVTMPFGGQVITGGSFRSVILQLFDRAVPPTYIAPSTQVTSTPSQGTYEVGTVFSGSQIALGHNFVQQDGGSETGTTFLKNGSSVGTPANLTLTTTTTFQAVTTYLQGPIKNDSHGNPYPTGRISAGTVTSAAITYTPNPNIYWGRCTGTTATTTEVLAHAGGNQQLTTGHTGSFTVTGTGSANHVSFSYPDSEADIVSIFVGGLDVTSLFPKTVTSFTNAQGYAQNYKIYTYSNSTSSNITMVIN